MLTVLTNCLRSHDKFGRGAQSADLGFHGHERIECKFATDPRRAVRPNRGAHPDHTLLQTHRHFAKASPQRGRTQAVCRRNQRHLIFVRRARELGFSLGEVRALLQLTGGQRNACATVKSITEKHIAVIRQRVKELNRLERALGALVAQCRGEEIPGCPILEALAAPAERG